MGVIYGALKQDAKVEESHQERAKHLDRMTEREKFRTLGGYYLLVTHNYEKAIENYVEWSTCTRGRVRPCQPRIRISNVRTRRKRSKKGARRSNHLRNTWQRTNYAMYAMDAGDFKTALAESNRVPEANPSHEYALLTVANTGRRR